MIAKVHILEGSMYDGVRLMACGHRDRTPEIFAVGRARLKEQGHKVTCKRCRAVYLKRYAMVLPGGDTNG